jgi:regulator of replication initiation timing
MDNQQWTTLIKELKDAINDAKDSQVRFTSNNTAYNKTINDGFTLIQDTIHDIDDLIGQLTALIDGLQKQIGDFETADQTPRLTAEIVELQKQLSDAKAIQSDAVTAMQESIAALNTNNELMKTSTKAQDVDGLNKTMNATASSLEDIKTRLQELLNRSPTNNSSPDDENTTLVNPRDEAKNQVLTDETVFDLPNSGGTITYGALKQLVDDTIKAKQQQQKRSNFSWSTTNPKVENLTYLTNIRDSINAVNATVEGIQNTIYNRMPFDTAGKLEGGKRKRKITKKQRKMPRNKTMKQTTTRKKRYRHTLSQTRTKYIKSKKRRIARL